MVHVRESFLAAIYLNHKFQKKKEIIILKEYTPLLVIWFQEMLLVEELKKFVMREEELDQLVLRSILTFKKQLKKKGKIS